jgi:hypothetical protein
VIPVVEEVVSVAEEATSLAVCWKNFFGGAVNTMVCCIIVENSERDGKFSKSREGGERLTYAVTEIPSGR